MNTVHELASSIDDVLKKLELPTAYDPDVGSTKFGTGEGVIHQFYSAEFDDDGHADIFYLDRSEMIPKDTMRERDVSIRLRRTKVDSEGNLV